MPPDSTPLADAEIHLIRDWIAQGAKNDLQKATPVFTSTNPPRYNRLPVVTSLDFSPDGSLLAIAGVCETVLLDAATGDKLTSRHWDSTPLAQADKNFFQANVVVSV